MNPKIHIIGARQNNLKNLNLTLSTGQIIVLTGVSGCGKSSLAFDTLYAEGQRRYVETFSPYARQFLDRMDKPQVEHIEGILPAIAIDQTNPVRNSRSTVGTMTELNDHLKLLFARSAQLYCRVCSQRVQRDNTDSIYHTLLEHAVPEHGGKWLITFPIHVPPDFTSTEITDYLKQQGYTRVQGSSEGTILNIVQDRLRLESAEPTRVKEALETAARMGKGRLAAHALNEHGQETQVIKFSEHLHCATCDIAYHDPLPSTFSFNSPLGACDACRGFGRAIGIDYGLVIPDENKALIEGVIKPWTTPSYQECQEDLQKYAPAAGVPLWTPWYRLTEAQRHWVLFGDPNFKNTPAGWKTHWYGVEGFFNWLETKSYKMHVRVLLSKYRSYTACPVCQSSRLKHDALLWRIGTKSQADTVLPPNDPHYQRFMPIHASWSDAQLTAIEGLCFHDLMLLPIERIRIFFSQLSRQAGLDCASDMLLKEALTRLNFLVDVGLGYLTLDRQSRSLSGGEVQRINLTTALGTSLVNTLFVLDEPSIGLHPRDVQRVVQVIERLRDAGNTLVVVEHDPQIIMAADRVIDMGPGPGERGGEIVFDGHPEQLRQASTLTGDYLGGRRRVEVPGLLPVTASTPRLVVEGISAHNLRHITFECPLGRLVCLTGVSGSGKSTLVQNVLYPALKKIKGKPSEEPGLFERIVGAQAIDEVVMVDQTPIGKTSRSNPVSYVGVFEVIRKLFAQAPLSVERGYSAGMFSFNSGEGRCPTCLGTGFEHVEMQFLSDVYLRCPDCEGKRFRPEILQVRMTHLNQHASIDEVLEMTVSRAMTFFKGLSHVQIGLTPLVDVGLEYIRLGQPVPTLSGGEAQRLKLAGHLTEASRQGISTSKTAHKGSLFLFDEPTTGLHFDDVARLMRAFRKLLAAGHTLLVVEHNLDVIGAADWIIDLGPEGGDAGGCIVGTGTPEALMQHPTSYTGQALREYARTLLPTKDHIYTSMLQNIEDVPIASSLCLAEPITPYPVSTPLETQLAVNGSITIFNAREHNLKQVNVAIPHHSFTVITGVSGSGKSTLAFDILFNEGQRRYLESLNAYARAIVQPAGRPEVDAIYGIPPTVAIEQRTSRGGHKSTVATMTEIYHFLRLLYVKLGIQYCPDCQIPVESQSLDQIVARLLRDFPGQHIGILSPLVTARKGYYTDLAKWAFSKGYTHLRVDGAFLPTTVWPRLDRYQEHTIELPVADLRIDATNETALRAALQVALEHGQGLVSVVWPLESLHHDLNSSLQQQHFSTKRACASCGKSFPEPDPRRFSYNSKHGWCAICFGTGLQLPGFDEQQTGDENVWNSTDEAPAQICKACHGQRLNPIALAVRFHDRSIAALAALSIHDAHTFFTTLNLSGRESDIARDILTEIGSRLNFMQEVGLDYLALDRAAPTLSGGEAQRLRLAAQLGSNLQGVCYILDEPTIGLHPRDNHILLNALDRLQNNGNTLVVVEHDEDTIRRASHIIDIGPGAGTRGGNVVAQGNLQTLMDSPDSITGRYLASPLAHPLQPRRLIASDHPAVCIEEATQHNLRRLSARFPIGRLSVVTGVSGSGKSTLTRQVLLTNLSQAVNQKQAPHWVGCARITGWERLDRVLEVDQTPIGKTPRSCPATYVGFWDEVRKIFAQTNEARIRGWSAARFSFNTGSGRCAMCEGQGLRTIEMSFLPNIKTMCDQCKGKRFNDETLSIVWQGKNIGEILTMEVDQAIDYFAVHPKLRHPLQLMQDVGLGYLSLGQASPTLSGGEAQRLKLVTELAKAKLGEGVITTGRASQLPHTLYVLDEPTIGLSMADVEKLIHVLHRLVIAGNTVVTVEHNLDIIAEADWVLDLGPEGGNNGGKLIAMGTPEHIASLQNGSHTAKFLQALLKSSQISLTS